MKREGKNGGAPKDVAGGGGAGGPGGRAPLAQLLEPAIDEERIAHVWQRLRVAGAAPVAKRPGRVRWLMVPAGLAVAAVAAWLLWLRPSAPSGVLRAVDAQISLAAGAELSAGPIELRDGSRLRLEQGARLQVLENDGQRFVAALRHGGARFEVKPGGQRWTIETELATIEVIGTIFIVAHEEHAVRVAVERGVVMVRGERVPGRVVRLVAGQELVVSESGAELAEASANPNPTTNPTNPTTNPTPIPNPTTNPPPSSKAIPKKNPNPSGGPSSSARVEAAKAPQRAPEAAPVSAASATKALRQADQLRQEGDERAAASLLEQTLQQHPDDPAAGMIEHSLGRLYLDRLGDPAKAARMFASLVKRGSPQPLVEGAVARHCEALWKAGDREAARAAFAEYERRYPAGSWHAALAALIGEP